MIRSFVAAALIALAAPASGQIVVVPLDPVDPGEVIESEPLPEGEIFPDPFATPPREPGSIVGEDVTTTEEEVVSRGTGAVLRGLDKLSGVAEDIVLATGDTAQLGWLQITLGQCRYPQDNPAGDAYTWLVIRENNDEVPIFEGWMVAASPALSALDHSRFDVWAIRCTTE